MRAKRVRFPEQEHKGSSFSDAEQVIGKLEGKGKVAEPLYRNECSKVLMGKRLWVTQPTAVERFLN
jgi:hypothetical protein